ncbi:MAG: hypothetical protein QOF57_2396 [Frankiaceae bacterium]|nr:hypothetical protein [Frankiaceae bacterium]
MTDASGRGGPGEPFHDLTARAVFEKLLVHESLTRDEVAELTGRSRVAAAAVVQHLADRGLVHRVGSDAGGPAARRYALTRTSWAVVGADIRRDEVTVAVADIGGTIRAQRTEPFSPSNDAAEALRGVILRCLADAGTPVDHVRRVVMGSPGIIDPATGELAYAVVLAGWKRSLPADLGSLLGGVPVVFENDVNLAAMAEARDGAGRGTANMVFAWMDLGVGLGIVLNGRLHRGRHGWSGEVGFMHAPVPEGQAAAEGAPARDSVHQLASGIAIDIVAERHGLGANAAAAMAAAASTGERGQAFLDDVAGRVAYVVSAVALVLNPSIVVLGGSYIGAAGPGILERVSGFVARTSPVPARIALAQVVDEPILRGALQTALDDARDGLFTASS